MFLVNEVKKMEGTLLDVLYGHEKIETFQFP